MGNLPKPPLEFARRWWLPFAGALVFTQIALSLLLHPSLPLTAFSTVSQFLPVVLAAVVLFAVCVFVMEYVANRELLAGLNEQERLVRELQASASRVKQLSGLLPICAACKKIRDDQGGWQPLEEYVHEHSEASFSHGVCPECFRQYYPGFEYTEK